MSDSTEVELHSKRLSDFHLRRILRASKHLYGEPITACLNDVFISAKSAVGIVFGHVNQGPHGRYADGRLLRTSDIRQVQKEGRFWVLTTQNSRYVVASFKRDNGRASFRSFLRRAEYCFH
nr:hypothetical protein [Pseudomonas sp. GM79]